MAGRTPPAVPALIGPPALIAAAALAAVPVVTLPLPWWTAPRRPAVLLDTGPATTGDAARWSGWELLGGVHGSLLVALAVAAAGAVVLAVVREGRWILTARVLLVAAGACFAVTGAVVLARWGAGAAALVAVVAGVGAAGLAAVGAPAVLVVALLAAAVPVLPGGPPSPEGERAAGPFVRIAGLDALELRGGTAGLAAPDGASVVVVDGRAGVATPDGLAVMDAGGRADVLALTPDGPRDRPAIIGVVGGRVVRWSAADAVTVTGLHAGDPVAVTVHGVGDASRLGAEGTLWLRAAGDPPGTARRLDLAARDGEQSAEATYLPVVTLEEPRESAPVDVATLLPAGDGAVRVTPQEAGKRLERLTSGPTSRTDVTVLAGALDGACGLTSSGRASFLPRPDALTADAENGLWFVTGQDAAARLVRLTPDGTLRAVAAPLPGAVSALAMAPAGDVVLAVRDADGPALWQLRDAESALTDLPPPPPDCAGAPAPVAPPVTLVPVGRAGRDTLGVPLGVDGRWAAGNAAGEIAVVAANATRTPVGVRRDGNTGSVWPDGSGGVWWLESRGEAGTPDTLVHGTRAGEQRYPPVADPAPREGSALVPDLGGRRPLLATAVGAFRIESGTPVRVVDGPIGSGAVRADGRGWVVADGRLLALDGDRVLGPVIDAGDRRADTAPVAVQFARGVAPSALALPRATVALDAAGRAVVVADDVVLAIDDDGAVTVVAQDRRLVGLAVFAAEGGLVAYDDGDLLRVDLP